MTMKTTTTYRIDYRYDKDSGWHTDSESSSLESAREVARKLRTGMHRPYSVRIVKKVTTVEYSLEMPETKSPTSVYDFLSEFGICRVNDVRCDYEYGLCDLATFDGLKQLGERGDVADEDKRVLTDGDPIGIYFSDQEGNVYYVCKYTEGNCQKLNDRLKKTRANNLMNTFKRIEFEG